jgi:molybdopterin molybdotransferase
MTYPSSMSPPDEALRMVLQVTQRAAPRSMGILTTGGELIGGIESPGSAQIRDSNSPVLAAMAGGVSMGRYDLVPESFRQIGAELVFHKVRQKPGKPLLLARRGQQLLFGLPGNPLAAHRRASALTGVSSA